MMKKLNIIIDQSPGIQISGKGLSKKCTDTNDLKKALLDFRVIDHISCEEFQVHLDFIKTLS